MDQQVLELERTQRLQEVRARLDPRAEAEVRGGGVFRGGELARRRLLHEGTLLWKTGSSRLKGEGGGAGRIIGDVTEMHAIRDITKMCTTSPKRTHATQYITEMYTFCALHH